MLIITCQAKTFTLEKSLQSSFDLSKTSHKKKEVVGIAK